MMRVDVLYFQVLRELAGTPGETLQVSDGATAGDVAAAAIALHPRLAPMRPSMLLAVNEEWARADRAVSDGDVVALMPPVSGG
jgi:molybdopterin converting factor subunit 1